MDVVFVIGQLNVVPLAVVKRLAHAAFPMMIIIIISGKRGG